MFFESGVSGQVVELFRILLHVVEFLRTISVLHVRPIRGSHRSASPHEREGGFLDADRGVFQKGQETLSLNALRNRQLGEGAGGGEHVDQLDDGGGLCGFLTGSFDDEGNPGHFFPQVSLLPKVVFSEQIAMVAGEENGCFLVQAKLLEGVENPPDLLVHEGDGSQITGPHSLLVIGKLVDSIFFGIGIREGCLGHVLPVALRDEGEFHLLEGVAFEILLGRDVRVVRANESGCQKEGLPFFLETFEKFDRFGCRFPVRLIRTVADVINGNEHPKRHLGGLAALEFGGEFVKVQASVVSRGMSLFAGHVVFGRPTCRHVVSIGSCDNVSRYAHVEDLADPGA